MTKLTSIGSMKKANYHGYTVFENGDIYTPNNRKMLHSRNSTGCPCVMLKYDGQIHGITVARLVYKVFNDDFDEKKVVEYKDGNPNKVHLSNLFQISRAEYFDRKGSRMKQKQFSEEEVKKIRAEYHNPSVKSSYRMLAEKYDCSTVIIYKIMKGTYFDKQKKGVSYAKA